MKRHGNVDSYFPAKIVHKKPLERAWARAKARWNRGGVIRPANMLFEVDGVTEAEARESLRLAATKLPIRTKFISRHYRAR